jgi:hypothetical protein
MSFPRTHFSGDEHEAFFSFDSMNQRGQALKVVRVIMKKARIGRYSEGHFAKTKMAVKHGFMFWGPGKFAHLSTLLMNAVCVQQLSFLRSSERRDEQEVLAINRTLWLIVVQ